MYDNIFVKIPDYWSKSRKENQNILKNQKKKYSIKEKIKLTTYFVLYILMLFTISIYIIFNINIITILSGVGVLIFLIDTSILFYKLI
jgi:cell division protein FtsL